MDRPGARDVGKLIWPLALWTRRFPRKRGEETAGLDRHSDEPLGSLELEMTDARKSQYRSTARSMKQAGKSVCGCGAGKGINAFQYIENE